MSGFKQNSIIVSNRDTPVTPTISGDLSITARNGRLMVYDGGSESQIAFITDISGGSGDITKTEVAAISSGLQTQINAIVQEGTVIIGGPGITASQTGMTWTVGLSGTFGDANLRNEVIAISSGLQTQINSIVVPTSATFLADYDNRYVNETDLNSTLSNYTLLSLTESISSRFQSQLYELSGNSISQASQISQLSGNSLSQASQIVALSSQAAYVNRISQNITQAIHGFSPGEALRNNGTIWVRAQADNESNSEALGIVETATTNSFVLVSSGLITISGGTYTPGEVYFLSDTVAGGLTSTEPISAGVVTKPLLFALTPTTGYVYSMRGSVQLDISYVDTSTSQNISGTKTFLNTVTFDSGIEHNVTLISISGTYSVTDDDYYIIADTNTAAGSITVQLPSIPNTGRTIMIKRFGTYGVVVDRNTKNIDSLAQNYTNIYDGANNGFYWSGNTTIGWALI
jgi:hypothetical protein